MGVNSAIPASPIGKMAVMNQAQKDEYQGRTKLLVRHFDDVPVAAAKIITKASATYGSRSRALQVALTVLLLSDQPISLRYRSKETGPLTRVSYKLHPKSVEMINRHTPVFGAGSHVIAACSVVLQEINDKMRKKK